MLTCPSQLVSSHTVAAAACSPTHTALIAITHAPILLIMLRFPNRIKRATRPRYAQIEKISFRSRTRLTLTSSGLAIWL